MYNKELIEKARAEKWARHRETDKREALIETYEKENRKLTQDELEKIRKIYNAYMSEGKEFKIDYINLILEYNQKHKSTCKQQQEDIER